MIDNTKEYILCAAIKRKKENPCHQCYNIKDIYELELGWRHPDILHRFKGIISLEPDDQGFFTSKGRFVSRNEGEIIARECGQISGRLIGGFLTSEDLY